MNILRQKRKNLGVTQLQAANLCGVSLRTYQTYEENDIYNKTCDELLRKLDEAGLFDGSNYIVGIKTIKTICRKVFKEQYPEIRCAYLYGSYARGEAIGKSDIDILIVLDEPMGLRYYGIASELEEKLNKKIDIQSYEQLIDNASMLKDILVEGIKIYGYKSNNK